MQVSESLDDTGWHILRELQENGRISYSELGRRVGLTPPAVAERVRRMEETGIIRGYRVELGGIAACLNRYPDIECCAVQAYTSAGVPVLIAYVVVASDSKNKDLTASDLREFLAPLPVARLIVARLTVARRAREQFPLRRRR